jgi:hypothetical protein
VQKIGVIYSTNRVSGCISGSKQNKMMKNKLLIVIIGVISINAYSQNEIIGKYSYTAGNYADSLILEKPFLWCDTIMQPNVSRSMIEFIDLYSDGTFWYYKGYLKKVLAECSGEWNMKDSLVILNSHIQRIQVFESYNKKSKEITISILPSNFPNETDTPYHLNIITEKEDTFSFYGQTDRQLQNFERIIIKEKIKIKSFWTEDMTGLKSLPYEVQSINSNIFNVLFYKGRVFENENWLIVGENRLRPRGANGKLQDYYLTKGK